MSTIENFILRFKTEGAGAVKNLSNDIKSLGDQINPLSNTLGGFTGRLGLLGSTALAGAAAFTALGLKAVNLADELSDLSDSTGFGADQIFNLKQTMMLAGGTTESFGKAATRLAVSIGEAMSGNEKYQKSFRDLGVYVTDASGKMRDSGDILQDVIARLAQIEDPAVRAARAVELMGKEAAKIDWSKVSAGRDTITAEQIAQLGRYRDEIDKFSNSIQNKLVTGFGSLAMTLNQFFKEYDSQGFDAFLSRLQVASLRMSGFGDEANKLRAQFNAKVKADEAAAAANAAEVNKLLKLSRANQPAAQGGGYGPPSEQTLKAIADSQLRIKQSQIEAERQLQLRGQGDIGQIEVNAKAEAAKAKEEIFSKERLTVAQKEAELAARVIEINAKRDTDIAKSRLQTELRIMNEQMAAQEQFAKELADYQKQVDASRVTALTQVRTLGEQTTELQARFDLQQSIIDLSTIDQERQTKIFDVIQQQKAALESLNALKDLPNDERLVREQQINEEYKKRIDLINAESTAKLARENDFSAGVKESMKRYEESMTPLKQGQQVADAVFSNMNSAVDRFVENGKFSFKGFAASVVQDLIKIQMRAAATQLFNSVLSTFGFGLPGKAAGGPVSAGQPYIVGERGPEVFMPNNAGSIIPNNQIGGGGSGLGGGQAITYNIQAVDAMSFKQMLAQDPSFLHAVAEQGRRTIPATRR